MFRALLPSAALILMAACARCAAGLGIEEALVRYNQHAEAPVPLPDEGQLARLAAGHTVTFTGRREVRQADGSVRQRLRVVALQRVQRPRLLVWLGALDVSEGHSERVTELLLSGDDAGGSAWYQHVNLPWPLRDRHWIIRNGKRQALARATGGLAWEHGWSLEPGGRERVHELFASGGVGGLDARTPDRAIYLDVNRGAWTTLALGDDDTLVIAQATTVMGGFLPDGWVARFTRAQLVEVMGNLERRADRVAREYDAAYRIFTGDGIAITPQDARAAHAAWQARRDRE